MTREPEESAPLDVEGAVRRLLDNRALYQAILREFQQRHHDDFSLLQARLTVGDSHGGASVSHSLRGAAKFIGAKRLELAAQQLELALRADSSRDLLPLLTELRSALDAALAAAECEMHRPQ